MPKCRMNLVEEVMISLALLLVTDTHLQVEVGRRDERSRAGLLQEISLDPGATEATVLAGHA